MNVLTGNNDYFLNVFYFCRPTPLDAFRKETKRFTFVGREIVIKQKWEEIGVAAVVWDAVSRIVIY